MMTGIAIGYLVGTVTAFILTLIFGTCAAINRHEGDLSKIYDADTLDLNFKTTNDNPSGDEENGRRTSDSDEPGESAGNKDE